MHFLGILGKGGHYIVIRGFSGGKLHQKNYWLMSGSMLLVCRVEASRTLIQAGILRCRIIYSGVSYLITNASVVLRKDPAPLV